MLRKIATDAALRVLMEEKYRDAQNQNSGWGVQYESVGVVSIQGGDGITSVIGLRGGGMHWREEKWKPSRSKTEYMCEWAENTWRGEAARNWGSEDKRK